MPAVINYDTLKMNVAAIVSVIFTTICTALTENVCRTKGCLEMASFITNALYTTMDPCDQFYDFVCQNWTYNVDMGDHWRVTVYDSLNTEVNNKLQASYEGKPSNKDPEWLKKLKTYHLSCMDTASLEKNSVENMKKQLNTYGVWPVLVSNWDETDFNWLELEKKFIAAGEDVGHLIVIALYTPDDGNSSRSMLKIRARSSSLDLGQILGGMDGLQNYLKALVRIAVIFGADRHQAEQDMKEVLKFEIALAQLVHDAEETNELRKISELHKAWPYISWLDFISSTAGTYNHITEDEPIIVSLPYYFENLGNLLRNTPKRVLANYLFSRVVFTNAEFLTEEIRNLTYAANNWEPSDYPLRSDTCFDMDQNMYNAMVAAYVRKYVPVKEKEEATKMTEMLTEELLKVITAADWMSNCSKTRAISKVKHIIEEIAYPDEFLNDTYLNNLYKDAKISASGYMNKRQLKIWNDKDLFKLLRAHSFELWDNSYLLTANPGYLQIGLIFAGYASAMEGLLFSSDRPMYLNLGTLGGQFARELTKSVNEVGRYYNDLGQYGNWWDSVTEKRYLKKRHALEDEYSYYRYTMEKLNVSAAVVNIIADQGGFKIARNAMGASLQTSGQDLKLPGLEDYSVEQMFWIASTLFYCQITDPAYTYVDGYTDTPSSRLRIMGSFRMSPQFNKDWNCPQASYMNADKKVNVW